MSDCATSTAVSSSSFQPLLCPPPRGRQTKRRSQREKRAMKHEDTRDERAAVSRRNPGGSHGNIAEQNGVTRGAANNQAKDVISNSSKKKKKTPANLDPNLSSFLFKASRSNRSTSAYSSFKPQLQRPCDNMSSPFISISPFIRSSQDAFAFKPTITFLSLFIKPTHASCSASRGILAARH